MKKYDAIVIGAGQAGSPLSHSLADKGWNVALIEREYLGGSCINFACTPTKTMVASARAANMAMRAGDFGIKTGEVSIDLSAVVKRKNEIVKSWREGQQKRVENRENLILYRGEARFVDRKVISVDDKKITAEKIFINTGTDPRVLTIEGLEKTDYLTNRNIMDLEVLPEHLIIIGGSYVGLEFGQMFRRFGSKVSIIEYNEQITPKEDKDIATELQEILESEGIHFYLRSEASRVERINQNQIQVKIKSQKEGIETQLEGSHLLIAVGRTPNTRALDLENASIVHDKYGYITVNDFLETNIEGIYALGDVKGGPMFTHISYNDYQIVYHNLFNEKKRSIKDRLIPYALFTDPELGRVGLTEKEAKESGKMIKVGKIEMSAVARAIERSETKGMMKIVVEADSKRILGAAVLGVEGGELVQHIMTVMRLGQPYSVLKDAVFIHPTLTEGFFSLMDQVEG